MAISGIKSVTVVSVKTTTKVEFSQSVKHLTGNSETLPIKLAGILPWSPGQLSWQSLFLYAETILFSKKRMATSVPVYWEWSLA